MDAVERMLEDLISVQENPFVPDEYRYANIFKEFDKEIEEKDILWRI